VGVSRGSGGGCVGGIMSIWMGRLVGERMVGLSDVLGRTAGCGLLTFLA